MYNPFILGVMHKACKFIKRATGKSIAEFCETELNSDYKAFITRLNNKKVKPSEALYISYITNKPVKELFSLSFEDIFLLRGDKVVSKSVRDIFSAFSEDEKLGFLDMIRGEGDSTPFKLPPRKFAPKPPVSPVLPIEEHTVSSEDIFDDLFIETYK
jgi:hypothetical protein